MSDSYRIGQYCLPKDKSYADFDTLGFNTARGMFIGIIKTLLPPMTVGLYGPWGSGKSTMIAGIAEQLKSDDCLTLTFDAWKYRSEKNLVLPLLCALQKEFLSNSELNKDSAKKVVGSIAVAALAGYIRHKTGIEIGDIRSSMELYEDGYKFYKKYDDFVSKVESEYKEFIGTILKETGRKRVVVFVDNLDRCLPDVVVNLLEDISSFLSIDEVPCVYVLAIDKDNVIGAIKHRFPDFNAAHYLEKIIQVSLRMPVPRQYSKGGGSAARYHFMKRYEWGKLYQAESSKGDSRDKVYNELAIVDPVFEGDLLGNPRRIERIINKLMLLETMKLFDAESKPNEVALLLFLILLAEYFPDVYGAVKSDSDLNFLVSVIQWGQESSGSPFSKRKERESLRPGSNMLNETIYNAYCDNERFFAFLRGFSKLSRTESLADRLKIVMAYLQYLG